MADDFSDLLNQQSFNAMGYGQQAANYADPFMQQRGQYQNQLSKLMANPGDFASSPVYKFAYDQGLGALNASAAAQGRLGSGNYLKALMDYGQGKASQLYFPQANLLAGLAQGGSSPAAAGLAYARGTERSQDYKGLSAANKAAGPAGGGSQTPWWQQPISPAQPAAGGGGANYGLPSGGAGQGMGYSSGGYIPSQGAGTGYVSSDYGTTTFGGGGGYQPSYEGSTGGYDPFAGYDQSYGQDYGFGGYNDYAGDYGDYGDY